MGLWWKRVNYMVHGGVVVDGLEKSFSKSIPIIWRFQNPWVVFKVSSDSPYWVYFYEPESGIVMRYRKKIETDFFAARIGPKKIEFFALKNRINLFESLSIEERKGFLDYSSVRKLKGVTLI